jgi:hypothetical protein
MVATVYRDRDPSTLAQPWAVSIGRWSKRARRRLTGVAHRRGWVTEEARQERGNEIAGEPGLSRVDGPHGARQRRGDGPEGNVTMSAERQRIDRPRRGGRRVDHDEATLSPLASQHREESGEQGAVGRHDDDPRPESVRDRDRVDAVGGMSDDPKPTIRCERAHARRARCRIGSRDQNADGFHGTARGWGFIRLLSHRVEASVHWTLVQPRVTLCRRPRPRSRRTARRR